MNLWTLADDRAHRQVKGTHNTQARNRRYGRRSKLTVAVWLERIDPHLSGPKLAVLLGLQRLLVAGVGY